MIDNILKSNNVKITKQRIEIINAIIKLSNNASIKNILSTCNNIDKSTVYRTIETLTSNNIIDKTLINNEIIYELKSAHKHYLKCIKCNKVLVLDECPISDTVHGYKVINHIINIDGLCPVCQKK